MKRMYFERVIRRAGGGEYEYMYAETTGGIETEFSALELLSENGIDYTVIEGESIEALRDAPQAEDRHIIKDAAGIMSVVWTVPAHIRKVNLLGVATKL